MQNNSNIDISLKGVGVESPRRTSIDIPLGNEPETAQGHGVHKADRGYPGELPGAQNISSSEMEMVNRHHAEVKEQHRRVRQQNESRNGNQNENQER
jgi:hypothetical protein